MRSKKTFFFSLRMCTKKEPNINPLAIRQRWKQRNISICASAEESFS